VFPEGRWIGPADLTIADLPDQSSVRTARSAGTDVRTEVVGDVPVRIYSQAVLRNGRQFVVQVVADRTAERNTLAGLLAVLVVGGLAAVALAGVAGFAYAGRALVPIRAFAASLRGDHRVALSLIDPLLTPEERAGRPRAIVNGFGHQALLMGLAGDVAASRLMTLAMADRLRPRRPDLRSLPTYVMLAELALMHREAAVAELVFEQLAALTTEGLKVAPGWPSSITRLLGGLTILQGDVRSAEEWLQKSLDWSRSCGAVVEEALTEFELARTHDGEAVQHIERGMALAARYGLPGLSSRSPAAAAAG